MVKKLASFFLALTFVFAVGAASSQPAEARGGRTAAIVGGTIIGLGILGAMNSSRAGYYGGCYKGPVRCERGPRRCYYNKYGDYVCRRGGERCYRPTYCD